MGREERDREEAILKERERGRLEGIENKHRKKIEGELCTKREKRERRW